MAQACGGHPQAGARRVPSVGALPG